MAAHKGINVRLWLWPAISVALLLSIGVLAGDTSAATSTGAPGAPATKAPAGPSDPAKSSPSVPLTPTCGPGSDYVVTRSVNAPIYSGVTDINNHCDDCVTNVALPFPYTFYGQVFNSINV